MSHGLHLLKQWGESLGFSREEISFLSISDIQGLISGTIINTADAIRTIIQARQQDYALENKIELPDIIKSSNDFDFFYKQIDKPNFITGASAKGELRTLYSSNEIKGESLKGKVVMTESADPGFDWLFGCSIAGLITKYGGANSHMAIRCAELNVPAAIGIGDAQHNTLANWKYVHLDCINESIKEN